MKKLKLSFFIISDDIHNNIVSIRWYLSKEIYHLQPRNAPVKCDKNKYVKHFHGLWRFEKINTWVYN